MSLIRPIPCIRWTARILGLVVTGLVLAFIVGTGGFNSLQLTGRDAALMLPFGIAIAGLVIAWWSELVGGLLAVDGILLFYGIHWYLTGRFPEGVYFGLIALPGLLFLAGATLDNKRRLVANG